MRLCFAGGDVLQWIIQRLWVSNLGEAFGYAVTGCHARNTKGESQKEALHESLRNALLGWRDRTFTDKTARVSSKGMGWGDGLMGKALASANVRTRVQTPSSCAKDSTSL